MREADEAVPIGPPPAAEAICGSTGSSRPATRPAPRRCIPATAFCRSAPISPQALAEAGIAFIGPTPSGDRRDGRQDRSRRSSRPRPGSSTVPGHLDTIADAERAAQIAREIGYPVMIKASAGGGGKGMRIARSDAELRDGFGGAQHEAKVELRRRPRLSRKIHRAAAPYRDPGAGRRARQHRPSRRARMLDPAAPSEGRRGSAEPVPRRRDARGDGRAGGGAGAGRRLPARPARSSSSSIASRNFYFLEMNTRLQVEHPVTEMVTGLDLVELMIRIAAGEKLPFGQDDGAADRLGDRGAGLCRGPGAQLPAVDRPAGALPPAGGRRRPGRCRRLRRRRDHALLRPDDRQARRVTAPIATAAIDRLHGALDAFYDLRRPPQHRVSRAICRRTAFRAGALSTDFIAEEFPAGLHRRPNSSPPTASLLVAAVAGAIARLHEARPARCAACRRRRGR